MTPPTGGVRGTLTDALSMLMGRATPGPDSSSARAWAAFFSILEGGGTMGAGGGAILPFFCRFALCNDMVGGGCDWVGCDFFCVPGLQYTEKI